MNEIGAESQIDSKTEEITTNFDHLSDALEMKKRSVVISGHRTSVSWRMLFGTPSRKSPPGTSRRLTSWFQKSMTAEPAICPVRYVFLSFWMRSGAGVRALSLKLFEDTFEQFSWIDLFLPFSLR